MTIKLDKLEIVELMEQIVLDAIEYRKETEGERDNRYVVEDYTFVLTDLQEQKHILEQNEAAKQVLKRLNPFKK